MHNTAIDGILGMDIMSAYSLNIDNQNQRIVIDPYPSSEISGTITSCKEPVMPQARAWRPAMPGWSLAIPAQEGL
jgi:hypothetical protein